MLAGSSIQQSAFVPRVEHRSVSATASSTSHTGAIVIGTSISGSAAHHSSMT